MTEQTFDPVICIEPSCCWCMLQVNTQKKDGTEMTHDYLHRNYFVDHVNIDTSFP